MPYSDEEYPGQPLWQSVLLFCCKGVIEVVVVLLFLWLLVQVLFTKQLEVHLQILLLVGLIIFCLSLILGCVLCWRKRPHGPGRDKDPVTSPPAEPVNSAQNSPLREGPARCWRQYEELDGDVLCYPSTFTSPSSSDGRYFPESFPDQPQTSSERKEQPKFNFSLRRLSTPQVSSPLYKPIDQSHSSLPSFPKLGLLSKTCRILQRRCTITGDSVSYDEHSRLTCSHDAVSPSVPEEPIPLAPLTYGSNQICQKSAWPRPCLHFTMAFSQEQQTLVVTVLGLSGTFHRLEDVSVLGSLHPLFPCPTQASVHGGLSAEPHRLVLHLRVNSVKELQRCTFRAAVYTRQPHGLSSTTLGELDAGCGGKDWSAGHPFHFTKELHPNRWRCPQNLLSQDVSVLREGFSFQPQILISLQYQPVEHRIRTSVLRAENLDKLIHTPATSDYQVVVNLQHEGTVISSRETEPTSSAVWNSSFLFDLPPGDAGQLLLALQYIIIQKQIHSESRALGRVLVGSTAADAGAAHWREMCGSQTEQTRWHRVPQEFT